MGTMKKFLKYLLLFIATFVIVTLLTNLATRVVTKKFTNYNILSNSPKITVSECTVANTNGIISGTITNDTDELINKIYLKIDGYNNNGTYLGSEYKELLYLYPNDNCSFEINFNWTNLDRIDLSLVNEK